MKKPFALIAVLALTATAHGQLSVQTVPQTPGYALNYSNITQQFSQFKIVPQKSCTTIIYQDRGAGVYYQLKDSVKTGDSCKTQIFVKQGNFYSPSWLLGSADSLVKDSTTANDKHILTKTDTTRFYALKKNAYYYMIIKNVAQAATNDTAWIWLRTIRPD